MHEFPENSRDLVLKLTTISGRVTAWLGREDSNLRMGESKSGGTMSNYKARSEFKAKSGPSNISYLVANSERASSILAIPFQVANNAGLHRQRGAEMFCIFRQQPTCRLLSFLL